MLADMIFLLKEAVNNKKKATATDRGSFHCKLMIFICIPQAVEAKAYSSN